METLYVLVHTSMIDRRKYDDSSLCGIMMGIDDVKGRFPYLNIEDHMSSAYMHPDIPGLLKD